MKLTEITKEEFDLFAKTLDCQNFFQCGAMKDFFDLNNQENYLIGLKDQDGNVKAAALLVYRSSFLGKKMYEATKGFIMDYNDLELVKEFSQKVYEFIKAHNGYRLLISPYIPCVERDTDANIVEGGFDNRETLKYLEKIGYKNIGVGVQVKWDYVLVAHHIFH